eukprot:9082809-Lingulodinium_polyedra.AAC.1
MAYGRGCQASRAAASVAASLGPTGRQRARVRQSDRGPVRGLRGARVSTWRWPAARVSTWRRPAGN